MISIYHAARQIINGVRPINDKIKYRFIGFAIAFVHFTFMCLFFYLHITLLGVYNAFITAFYCFLAIIIGRKENYTAIFGSAFVEILFHSILASLMLGWDWGFMLYTIALVPTSFYLTYTLPYFKGSVKTPITTSLIVWVCYITVSVITNKVSNLYPVSVPEEFINLFHYYNIMLAFSLLMICSILFAVEIRYMQHSLEKENHTLGEIANFDPLTHLLNRRSMTLHLKQVQESGNPFCLIMADIDNFKKVNDTYGHACGDEVLISVADVVAGNVREEDYVCRWGGEEILILLNAELEVAKQVAERICKDVSETIVKHDETEIKVTMTLGVAQNQEGDVVRTVIERADEHLYYGKEHGKNQVVA